jgi:hypothetical protein
VLQASDSRRIANALMGSNLDPTKRSQLADATSSVETFIELPQWVQDFVISAEKNPPNRFPSTQRQ